MQEVTATYIGKNQWQRLYKLSKPIHKFYKKSFLGLVENKMFCIDDLVEEEILLRTGNPKYEQVKKAILEHYPDNGGWQYILISDAHTHCERLAFLGGLYENEVARFSSLHIGGEQTMRIHGGDSFSMLDDEEYLKQLCELNGMCFTHSKMTT